ncbi:MAG: cell division protein ZapA [Burkholderiaceae bacterium]|nr:cell division protein ZapA [Burkholderiaceae bacterium]
MSEVAISTERLTANIMGRDYQLACAAEERPTLLEAVKLIDDRMRAIQAEGKIKSADRIAVMVCLNLAVELLSTKPADKQWENFRDTIHRINMLADQALLDVSLATAQEKLF